MKTKQEIAEYKKQYALKNKHKLAEKRKQYVLENKERITEHYKQYYLKNKEKICKRVKERSQIPEIKIKEKEYDKNYYLEHREEIIQKEKERAERLDSNPETAALRKKYREDYYLKNQVKEKADQRKRTQERMALKNRITLYYGCQNPNCSWKGQFHGCQLDLHHYNPEEKDQGIGALRSHTIKKFIAEINKCVVLCRNCHQYLHAGGFTVDESKKCKIDPDTLWIQSVI